MSYSLPNSHRPHALQCRSRTSLTACRAATYSAIAGLDDGNCATPAGSLFPLARRNRPIHSSLHASGPKCFRNASKTSKIISISGVMAGCATPLIICLDCETNYPLIERNTTEQLPRIHAVDGRAVTARCVARNGFSENFQKIFMMRHVASRPRRAAIAAGGAGRVRSGGHPVMRGFAHLAIHAAKPTLCHGVHRP